MPKKPAPTGYFYFMLDFKKREEARGRRFPNGMKDVQLAASDDWKKLSQMEKDHYNRYAKEMKHSADRPNYVKSDEKRYNSEGKSFAEIKREQQRENERIEAEKRAVRKFVDDMNMNDLRNKFIYLIHVHYFCKTTDDTYYPAELAIVRFNLSQGVCGVLHRYIDPGEFQLGYSCTAKEQSESSHKLSREFVSRVAGAQDHSKMYEDIITFLQEHEKVKGEIPPLFSMPENVFHRTSITAARKTLKIFYEAYHNYDTNWDKVFQVYELPELFTRLKNKCVASQDLNLVAFPNSALANDELYKDSYDIDFNMACKFHQDEDAVSMCSKIFVIKWTYIMRDHCCESLGIDPQGEEECVNEVKIKQEFSSQTVIKTEKCYDYDEDNYSTSSGYSFMTANSTLPTVKKEMDVESKYSSGTAGYGSYNFADNSTRVKDEKYSVYGDASKMENKFTVKDEKYDMQGEDTKVQVKIEKIDVDYENSANSSASNNMPTLARMMQEMQPHAQSSAWGGVPKRENVPAFTNDHFPALGRGRGRRGR